MLKYGAVDDEVLELKRLLNKNGSDLDVLNRYFGAATLAAVRDFQKSKGLVVDGEVGPQTWDALGREGSELVQPPDPKWLDEAKKHDGKTETNSRFVAFLAPFWRIVGLPGYKRLSGSAYAWCGLFVAAMLSIGGYTWQKNGAGARNWAKYGQEINWRVDGIPRGAILHINHGFNCNSGASNHVGFSDGDCTAADLQKRGATINIFGGNQGNTAKVSAFDAREICHVRWPPEALLPPKVLKSVGCQGKPRGESTR